MERKATIFRIQRHIQSGILDLSWGTVKGSRINQSGGVCRYSDWFWTFSYLETIALMDIANRFRTQVRVKWNRRSRHGRLHLQHIQFEPIGSEGICDILI